MFKYYNRNPNKIRTQDCVCRAISSATGLRYEAIDILLEMISREFECDKLCVCCYNFLLEDILGYEKFENFFQSTVSEISKKYPSNSIIIRIEGHLTTSINGSVTDIWDCSDELVDKYWIVS